MGGTASRWLSPLKAKPRGLAPGDVLGDSNTGGGGEPGVLLLPPADENAYSGARHASVPAPMSDPSTRFAPFKGSAKRQEDSKEYLDNCTERAMALLHDQTADIDHQMAQLEKNIDALLDQARNHGLDGDNMRAMRIMGKVALARKSLRELDQMRGIVEQTAHDASRVVMQNKTLATVREAGTMFNAFQKHGENPQAAVDGIMAESVTSDQSKAIQKLTNDSAARLVKQAEESTDGTAADEQAGTDALRKELDAMLAEATGESALAIEAPPGRRARAAAPGQRGKQAAAGRNASQQRGRRRRAQQAAVSDESEEDAEDGEDDEDATRSSARHPARAGADEDDEQQQNDQEEDGARERGGARGTRTQTQRGRGRGGERNAVDALSQLSSNLI